MSDVMPTTDLETTLVDIGRSLRYPESSAIAARVHARIARPRTLRERWSLPGFVPALATIALLLVVIALASPGVRAAADEFLRLRGIDIFRVPGTPVPSVTPSPSSSSSLFIPGDRVSLDEARRRVHFTVLVPAAAELGAPDELVVDTSGNAERVTLVYRDRAGVGPSPAGLGPTALVVEFRGSVDASFFGKLIGGGTTLEEVTVNGGRGYWIAGTPHFFFYRDAAGAIQQETLRLAGNTLIWEQGGVTMRLEAAVTKDQAIRLASTAR
jgi:hypothetical protein